MYYSKHSGIIYQADYDKDGSIEEGEEYGEEELISEEEKKEAIDNNIKKLNAIKRADETQEEVNRRSGDEKIGALSVMLKKKVRKNKTEEKDMDRIWKKRKKRVDERETPSGKSKSKKSKYPGKTLREPKNERSYGERHKKIKKEKVRKDFSSDRKRSSTSPRKYDILIRIVIGILVGAAFVAVVLLGM